MSAAETSSTDRIRQSYDDMPYDSAPILRSNPARLAGQALWRGLDAPDAARARVLEIGCASGGNILPMAAQLPQAVFLGVDLSPVQIAAGEARRKLYGLTNVELRAASFEALGAADGEFDFIICHGVYAWIPEPLRDSLLRVVRERLAPTGVAMVSFNILPGWRVNQVVRDAMLLHAGDVEDPKLRAEKARELFGLLEEETDDTFTYGKIWRLEAQRMLSGGDPYIAHEVFEENNNPETFAHFHARAQRHDLDYLCESSVFSSSDADLMRNAPNSIRRLSGGDRLKRESYIDIFSGRSFREALLVRKGRADTLAETPQNLDVTHFLPALELGFGPAPEKPGEFQMTLKQFTIPVEAALEPAIRRLMARSPASSRLVDLAPEGDPQVLQALGALMVRAAELGLVWNSSLPVACAARLPEKPRLWSLAAIDAVDCLITATLRHSPFRFAQLQRLIGPLTDGTRTRDQLVGELVDMAERGVFRIGSPEGPVTEREAMRERLQEPVDRALAGFMHAGLLLDG